MSADESDIEGLIEASSLGAPAVKAIRESVSDEDARRIIDRVNELTAGMTDQDRLSYVADLVDQRRSLGDIPVRQKSAQGQPKPNTSITRTCRVCGASFLGLAPGKTGERGLWNEWHWYCSVECARGHVPGEVPPA